MSDRSLPLPSAMRALDPYTQAFPTLTAEQIDRVRSYGKIRAVAAGETVFQAGDSHISMFIVLSGKLDILQPTKDGERLITTHFPSAFTGEINMISGRRALVHGRVAEAGEFLEIGPDNLRTLIAKDAELSEVFMRAFILRRLALVKQGFGDAVVMGSMHCAATLRIREFLGRNGHPYEFVDLDKDRQSQELLDQFQVSIADVPVLICRGTKVLRHPTLQEVAECLGFNSPIDEAQVRDLIVVGAGPSGLGAAVYAASEGLDVLVIESNAPGGQAGSSSKIENYLGFPVGISGSELATRAINQAQKFGAEMMVAHDVVRLHCNQRPYQIELDNGTRLTTRSIVIATGAQYNKPAIPGLARFESVGVYYGATNMEAQLCEHEEVIVVGGGNSAGQAAVYLSGYASRVHILVRSGQLSDTMSRYLVQRIETHPKISLHLRTEIVGLEGQTHLESVQWKDKQDGRVETMPIRHIFMMTGAVPNTAWLKGSLAMDNKGFIVTGHDLQENGADKPQWSYPRSRYLLETSLPGVFAVGDARAGNVKRVASAVGEGSISVHLVHRVLSEM